MLTIPFQKAKLAVVLLVLSNVRYSATSYCTQTESSIKSMMLRQYVFKTFHAPTSLGCLVACEEDVRCQSFNYIINQDICELNNPTKEARPEHFIFDVNRYYYGMVRKRVPLGSIPELPAQSCREIKASEGEHAVNGSYWIELIHLGKIIYAECDMDAEGKLAV
ncbi:unnamed protein product [Porites evermanni]|uniref:Apple domain-containing protein n=1 Tax=Porites evermanni TaxID=104178 RepID=A0ABN8T3A5_9CNID|nr:unnamed protein product [Porites evermanni]